MQQWKKRWKIAKRDLKDKFTYKEILLKLQLKTTFLLPSHY